MTQPTTQASFTPPWFLIVGVLAGAALIAFIVWDSPGNGGKRSGGAHVVEITEATWQKEVVQSQVPVVIDFTASWCGPCQMLAPTIDKLAERYQGKVKVGKLDMGDHSFNKGRNLAEKFGIDGVPHVMIFTGGDQPFRVFQGVTSEAKLAQAIDAALATR
jgi:thioredoxin 1